MNKKITYILLGVIAALVIALAGLATFIFTSQAYQQDVQTVSAQEDAEKENKNNTIAQSVAKENTAAKAPAQQAAQQVAPQNVLSDGYHSLHGSMYKSGWASQITVSFTKNGNSISNATFTNHKANDGSCPINMTMHNNGATLAASGYDNIGNPFNFTITKTGNSYSGNIAIIGSQATLRANMTLQ